MKNKNESIQTKQLIFREMIAHSKIFTVILLCLVMFASILVLTLPEDYSFVGLNKPVVGQEAPKTVYAAMEFTVPDTGKIARMRQECLDALPLYFFRDEARNSKLKEKCLFFVDEIGRRYKIEQHASKEKVYEALAEHTDWQQDIVSKVRSFTFAQNRYLYQKLLASQENRNTFLQAVYPLLDSGVMKAELRNQIGGERILSIVFDKINEMAPKKANEIYTPDMLSDILTTEILQYYNAGPEEKNIFRDSLCQVFVSLFDEGNVMDTAEVKQYNRQKQEQALLDFEKNLQAHPVEKVIAEDAVIIRKNAILTQEDIEVLTAYRQILQKESVQSVSWQRL